MSLQRYFRCNFVNTIAGDFTADARLDPLPEPVSTIIIIYGLSSSPELHKSEKFYNNVSISCNKSTLIYLYGNAPAPRSRSAVCSGHINYRAGDSDRGVMRGISVCIAEKATLATDERSDATCVRATRIARRSRERRSCARARSGRQAIRDG